MMKSVWFIFCCFNKDLIFILVYGIVYFSLCDSYFSLFYMSETDINVGKALFVCRWKTLDDSRGSTKISALQTYTSVKAICMSVVVDFNQLWYMFLSR